jgi:hypothetical protein
MSTFAIDEQSRRLPGFTPGKPVKLADGQVWEFPAPELTGWALYMIEAEDGTVSRVQTRRHSPDQQIDKCLTEWAEADALTKISAGYTLAARMLARNYELTAAERSKLLPFIPDSDENQAMWDTLTQWATGLESPKP